VNVLDLIAKCMEGSTPAKSEIWVRDSYTGEEKSVAEVYVEGDRLIFDTYGRRDAQT
jgi:hypothetical protein